MRNSFKLLEYYDAKTVLFFCQERFLLMMLLSLIYLKVVVHLYLCTT